MEILPFERTKTKDGRVRDKVAILGFAGTTRHLTPFDNDEWEIWGLNEAHRQPWMKRFTRWFQIHKRWDFMKQNNESYKEHWEWLQKEQPFPIYMQEKYPDIPSSVNLPLREIVEKFCSNYQRGTLTDSEVIEYFTSSFAYMGSMALFMGFKEIGVWGFEMATDTEYRYQKGSTEFWLGIMGQHAKILLPNGCQLLNGKLYGYEVSRMINRQRLEFLRSRYDHELKQAEADQNRINGRREEVIRLFQKAQSDQERHLYAARQRDLLELEVRANGSLNERRGRLNMIADLIKTVDNMHMGKDPGDGFAGADGDLDPQKEQEVQDAAEQKAQDQELTAEVGAIVGAGSAPDERSEGNERSEG